MITKTISSGVKCCIVPQKGFVEKQAMIAVKFGSDTAEFSIDGRCCTLPAGTAHFIEHKMFDMPDGNAMSKLSDIGADANAFTTFNETAYYFTCTEGFYESLETLIKMVSKPYFIPESINAEKNIIAREINMYEDDPQWKCYFGLLKALYGNMSVSNPIAGTETEIEKINADLMNFCYDAFYTPKNIMLIAAGDIDADKIIEIAEKSFSLSCDKNTKVQSFSEQQDITERIENFADIKIPLFGIGFRGERKNADAENIVRTRLLIDAAFGDCSRLYQRLLDKNLLDFPINAEYLNGRCYNAVLLTGSSSCPEAVLEEVQTELEQIRKNGPINLDKTVKKQWGLLCMQQDNLDSICNAIAACFAKNIDFLDICNIYGKMVNEKNLCLDMLELGNPVLSTVSGKR